MTCPLEVGDWTHIGGYGFALHHKLGLVVCKGNLICIYFTIRVEIDTKTVLTIYSKTGGSNGKHAWVDKANIITAASNIVIQVFEFHFGTLFSERPPSHKFPQLKCFDIIPSALFLCALQHSPAQTEAGLKISTDDSNLFKCLKAQMSNLTEAIKELTKKKKKSAGDNDGED